jgi:hypothetical protein
MSSFSEPGPKYHRFGTDSGTLQQTWALSSARHSVTGTAKEFSVTRQIFIQRNRILVNDTVRASPAVASGVVGIEVQHRAEITGARPAEATVPGAMWSFHCNSLNEDSESGQSLHRGTSGNPSIHVRAEEGGLAMLPLDDVFEVHAWTNNSAVARFPRMPTVATGNPHTKAPFEPAYKDCAVTDPPSLTITDPYFALRPGDVYTMEWAIYPGNSSCADYYCFINRLRDDLGVSGLTLVGTGGLGQLSMRTMHEPMLTNAGYGAGLPSDARCKAWEDFTDEEFVRFLDHQAMHFVVNTIPYGNYTPECPLAEKRCYGSCFVNTLDSYSENFMRFLINRTRTLSPERSAVVKN